MTFPTFPLRICSFEREILQALKDGHWPDGCSSELRTHVGNCASCSDLVLVTQTFQRARSESVQQLPAGSPSLLWWRAQLRRRNAAAQSIDKPIRIAQVFAWAVVLMVFAVFVAAQFRHGLHWAEQWLALVSSYFSHTALSATKLDWNPLFLISGLGLLVFVSGVVFYLASEKQ
jgi:hypothetical protein